MDLVVGVLLEQGVGDLGQAEPLLPVHDEGNDAHAVEVDRADLLGRSDVVCFRFLEGILSLIPAHLVRLHFELLLYVQTSI